MPGFKVEHIRGIEEVKLCFSWRDDDGHLHKRGVVIEVSPEDLPVVEEGMMYPRMFLSRRIIDDQRV